MRWVFGLALVAGCGFQANNGGQDQPIDAPAGTADARQTSDASMNDASADAMQDASIALQCPAGYDSIVGFNTTSRYRFVATSAKWIDAENDCEDDANANERATHLIVLDDTAERTAMLGGLLGGTLIDDQYIGQTDLADDETFVYVTNQQVTLITSPTGDDDPKDCVRIKSTGVAESRSCDETNRYVCECDGNPAVSSRFPNPPFGNGND